MSLQVLLWNDVMSLHCCTAYHISSPSEVLIDAGLESDIVQLDFDAPFGRVSLIGL